MVSPIHPATVHESHIHQRLTNSCVGVLSVRRGERPKVLARWCTGAASNDRLVGEDHSGDAPTLIDPTHDHATARTSSKNTSLKWVDRLIWTRAEPRSPATHRNQEERNAMFGRIGVGSDQKKAQSQNCAALFQTFWPVTTNSSPSRSALRRK